MSSWRYGGFLAHRRARWRDRRVYLVSHPILFLLLAFLRTRPIRRLGRGAHAVTVVSGTDAVRDVLVSVPLDRVGHGTTGAAARALATSRVLFDEDGAEHKAARRMLASTLSRTGVEEIAWCWREPLAGARDGLMNGGVIDAVELASVISGRVALLLSGSAREQISDDDAKRLSSAAGELAALMARAHLPTAGLLPWRRARHLRAAHHALERLTAAASAPRPTSGATEDEARHLMVILAAVNTTVAAVPRALAWVADARLWPDAQVAPDVLAVELLRVTAATAVLPRAASRATELRRAPHDGQRRPALHVPRGGRLYLVTRHAALAHALDPSITRPAPAAVSQLVFGAGSHACPGALLARTMLADALKILAPAAPTVVGARASRRSALPSWRELHLRATQPAAMT